MLEKFIPKDTLISYSEQYLFKIEKIISATGTDIKSYCDYVNQSSEKNFKNNLSLMFLLYDFILKNISQEIEDYLFYFNEENPRVKNNFSTLTLNLLVFVSEENEVISYKIKDNASEIIKDKISEIPNDERSIMLNWFISEFERCTNFVLS